jgi:methylaspartate ammonia-lyase
LSAPVRTHGPNCICRRCQGLRRRLAREALVEPRVLVYADETAAHIEALTSSGMRRIEIARRAGLSPAVITKASRATSTIDASTAERILAV